MATLKQIEHTLPLDVLCARNSLCPEPTHETLEAIFERYKRPYHWPDYSCLSLISDLTQYYTEYRAPYHICYLMKEHHAIRHYSAVFGGMRNVHSALIKSTGMIETLHKPNIGLVVEGWLYFPELKGFHECDDYFRAMPVFKYLRRWYAFTKQGLNEVQFDDAKLAIGWKCPRQVFYGY